MMIRRKFYKWIYKKLYFKENAMNFKIFSKGGNANNRHG